MTQKLKSCAKCGIDAGMETNSKNKNEIAVSPSVRMALRSCQSGFLLVDGVVLALLILITVCFGLCFLFSNEKMRTALYYERINCIKYEQTYEEIFIPALGKKQLTKVNRCVEYEVFE